MDKADLDWLIELARRESWDTSLTEPQRETAGRACAGLAGVRTSLGEAEALMRDDPGLARAALDAKSWIETGEWPGEKGEGHD